MRLTLKELELLNTASAYSGEQHKAICGKAVLELIEYKQIEEELGIDFILFKALQQGFIYVDTKENNKGISEIQKFEVGGILFDNEYRVWRLSTADRYDGAYWGSIATNKNYGKTWALTREALK